MTISLPGSVRLRPHPRNGFIDVSATGDFTPAAISGLQRWWRADALALADGAAVASWTDSSANALALTQATGSLQPLYKATAGANGKPAVQFDGVDDFMSSASNPWTGSHSTTFLVLKTSGGVGVQSVLWTGNDRMELRGAGSEIWQFYEVGFNSMASGDAHTAFAVLAMDRQDASPQTSYRNGSVVATMAHLSVSPGGIVYVGGRTASHQAACLICEILVYDKGLSTTERGNVTGYLGAKYGITVV